MVQRLPWQASPSGQIRRWLILFALFSIGAAASISIPKIDDLMLTKKCCGDHYSRFFLITV